MDTPGYRPSAADLVAFRPGIRGLVLAADVSLLPPEAAVRLDNWRVSDAGRLRVRPGLQTALALVTVAGVHSISRLAQPSAGTYMGYVGTGTILWRGSNPASYAPVSTTLSGNPLTFLPYRPALSGDPWMIVGDSSVLGQVPPTGEALLLGLPEPAAATTTRIVDILTTKICDFHGVDAASAWTLTGGFDDSDVPVPAGTPTASDVVGLQGDCVEFTTNPGSTAKGYLSILGRPRTMDLTTLQAGFREASAEDMIHGWLRINRPGLVEEIRVYLVCASGFSANVIPGQNDTLNTDAFVKTFQPSDLTGFLETQQTASEAAQTTQATEVITDYLDQRSPEVRDAQGGDASTPENRDPEGPDPAPNTMLPESLAPGRNVWTEYGVAGRPLRRGDFTRIGSTAGRGWDTITGIVIVVKTAVNQSVKVAFDDWYLTGGYGLDSTEVGAQAYDYRCTHFHLDTGDEGNPSPLQAEGVRLRPVRQRVGVQPAAAYTGAGNARVRQRFYRRGGLLNDDWRYVGQNTANGAEFIDTLSDLDIAAADTVQLDNYQPVPTIDVQGNTVLAAVLPAVWGPLEGAIYGCGDTYRPGHLYRSKTGKPGSWPPDLSIEVCSPSEELMHGWLYGGQGFVFSRRRLFVISPNLINGSMTVQDTPCQKGLAGRWAFDVGPEGCIFVSDDGIYLTSGGAAQSISEDLRPLWQGRSFPGAVAINLSAPSRLRITIGKGLVFFFYQGTDLADHILVYDQQRRVWSRDVYAYAMRCGYVDREHPELPVFLGASADGFVFGTDGTSDVITGITAFLSTPPTDFKRPREEKQLGDLVIESSYLPAANVLATTYLDWNTALPAVPLVGNGLVAQRQILDPSGGQERRFQKASIDISAAQPATIPPLEILQLQLSAFPLAEETFKRLGQWEPLGQSGAYLTGVAITCDTREHVLPARAGAAPANSRTVLVEYSRGGGPSVALGPFEVDASQGRRTIYLSWAGVRADQVRLVPQDDAPWLLYHLEWQAQAEPARQGSWDSNDEALGDTYYTGLDLVLDTGGLPASLACYVDGQLIHNQTVQALGKQLVHVTFGPGYGHVYRFYLTAQPGAALTVYQWEWKVQAVPGEQANWNRNFEVAGTLTDKWVKGVLLECDTGGVAKSVRVEADGVLQQTLSVSALGRQVVHLSFPQFRGRVLRLLPTDTQLSRLWTVQWIFDEEPLALTRWETQPLDHGQTEGHSVYEVTVEYRAVSLVTLTILGFDAQGQEIFEDDYPLVDTGGRKRKVTLGLRARRAVLWQYRFTAAQPFWLYREGSRIQVIPWDGGPPAPLAAPFGNDDLDHNRAMGNASGIASTPNNGLRTETPRG